MNASAKIKNTVERIGLSNVTSPARAKRKALGQETIQKRIKAGICRDFIIDIIAKNGAFVSSSMIKSKKIRGVSINNTTEAYQVIGSFPVKLAEPCFKSINNLTSSYKINRI
ncbi:MAG TPA: hypothetical protein VJ861_05965 [Treponemataceae bacterium]|nr:hypothetical protein [Treponemataceae bacterium]